MSLTTEEKVHGIIHTAATAAAGVGGGLAQAPGSDKLLIVPIQLAMITSIAGVHGTGISETSATGLLGTFTAVMFGRFLSQLLVGWIPLAGNAINAGTAFALTEAVGWSAHKYFEDLGCEDHEGVHRLSR